MSLWDILFALSLLGLARYGDYITDECPQAGYVCPKICDVDHKHYPRKECEDARRKGNIWKAGWKTSKEKEPWKESDSTKEEVLIKGYKDAKTEQESKRDTTAVQSLK